MYVHLSITEQLLRCWNKLDTNSFISFSTLIFVQYLLFITVAAENPATQKYAIKKNAVRSNVETMNYLTPVVCSISGRYCMLIGVSLKN